MVTVLTTFPHLSHQELPASQERWPQAAAFVTITSSKGPEKTRLVRDLSQGRKFVQEVRLGDRLSWPVLFTSPARHSGTRLEQISGKEAVADRLFSLLQKHLACRPWPFPLSLENTPLISLR